MHKMLLGVSMGLALLSGIAGCANMGIQERATLLGEETRAYRKAMRWGAYDLAHQLVRRRDGSAPAFDARALEGIRITSFEITNREMTADSGEAIVSAEISYYHVESGRVKTIKDRQTWWYDETTKHWYIDGSLPDFAAGLK